MAMCIQRRWWLRCALQPLPTRPAISRLTTPLSSSPQGLVGGCRQQEACKLTCRGVGAVGATRASGGRGARLRRCRRRLRRRRCCCCRSRGAARAVLRPGAILGGVMAGYWRPCVHGCGGCKAAGQHRRPLAQGALRACMGCREWAWMVRGLAGLAGFMCVCRASRHSTPETTLPETLRWAWALTAFETQPSPSV